MTTKTDDDGARLRHLARALAERATLAHTLDSVVRALPIPAAVALTQRFLPPGATVGHPPPLVTIAIFRNDAYSAGPRGIVVDLVHVEDSNLTDLLAHEFHHWYIGYVTKAARAPADSPDAAMVNALFSLRNEGAADQIDKPYPLVRAGAAMAQYVARYNDEYQKTPATLHTLDSLVTAAAGDTEKLRAVGERASVSFGPAAIRTGIRDAHAARALRQGLVVRRRAESVRAAARLRERGGGERRNEPAQPRDASAAGPLSGTVQAALGGGVSASQHARARLGDRHRCSKCADSVPSSVTIVHRSASVFVAGPPTFTIGSIASVSPGTSFSRRFGLP